MLYLWSRVPTTSQENLCFGVCTEIKEHISFTVLSKDDSTITTANSQRAGHFWSHRILMLSEFLMTYLNLFVISGLAGLIFSFK